MTTPTSDPNQLVRQLLDRGYTTAAGSVLEALNRELLSNRVWARLQQLDEAAREAERAATPFRPDQAELRALLADLQDTLQQTARAIAAAAPRLEESAVEAAARLARGLTLPNLNDRQLAALGIRWNTPDPEAVAALVRYSTSLDWRRELERYQTDIYEAVSNAALRGIVLGKNPRAIARDVVALVQSMPRYRAEALMRTIQLQSYRDATSANLYANRDILQSMIRIAVLDNRTCLACIAEHGSELPVGSRILDHHNGRCTAIGRVFGLARTVPTGEQWFNSLPPDRQLAIAGPGAYELLQSGRARLADFVDNYTDPVFGSMLREASLTTVRARA